MNNLFGYICEHHGPNLPNFYCNKRLEQEGEIEKENGSTQASRFKSLPMKLRFAHGSQQ
jgi:hypothetical protein